jgi:hypothetical protein
MSAQIVPLKAANRKKGGATPRPKSLTLADIAITWTEGEDVHYVTGKTVARLVCVARQKYPFTAGHDPESGTERLPMVLRGLSYLVFPDPGTPHEDREKDVRFTVSELLDDAAAVVYADQLTRPESPTEYRIHVGPIPEEWT